MSTTNTTVEEQAQQARITAIVSDALAGHPYCRRFFPLASRSTESHKVGQEPFDDPVSD